MSEWGRAGITSRGARPPARSAARSLSALAGERLTRVATQPRQSMQHSEKPAQPSGSNQETQAQSCGQDSRFRFRVLPSACISLFFLLLITSEDFAHGDLQCADEEDLLKKEEHIRCGFFSSPEAMCLASYLARSNWSTG
jgi:hypothetical protein